MRIRLLGGLDVEHEGAPISIAGSMQLAVLFRLAVDAGSAVGYRAIAEDVWPIDPPENSRAALQSIVSRLRSQLPPGSIESTPGGYRLAIARTDVDALAFTDLVASASRCADLREQRALAEDALALWSGEPWTPADSFDWFGRDLRRDHATATSLLGSVTPQRSAIPAPLTALVGREPELASIAAQLEQSRLVTIVGSGGAGKTRLAVEAARQVPGAILVELAPVGSTEVFAAVAAALGRELRSAESTEAVTARARILDALLGRDVLLVLDNCEHVIDAAARLADDLLGALPQLTILATSREPLGVPGEAFVTLGPLPHPRGDIVAAEQARGFEAVELFRQRAQAATGTDLDDAALLTAARIAARLDGLPLALELAAAKLRTMSPEEVLAGLDDRFSLLTGGFRTALPRHQTLRAMIDWSWSLLSDDERAALSRIAVFPAGVGVRDAGEVAGAMGFAAASVFDSLVDRSLLQRSRGRYRALETIREYGIERLAEAGELADVRAAQARSVAERAVRYDSMLRRSTVREAIDWFDSEDDNIAAALRFSVESGLPEVAVRLAVASAWYWIVRDRGEDAQAWFAQLFPLIGGVDSSGALLIRAIMPIVVRFAEDRPDGAPVDGDGLDEMLADLDAAVGPDANELVQIIPPMIRALAVAGRSDEWMIAARVPRGEELGLAPWSTALLHVVRAVMAHNRGDISELGDESELAVRQFEALGDPWGLALAQQFRAEWLAAAGRLDEAFAMTELSTDNMRRITTSWDLAQQQGLAISILVRQGRHEEAHARLDALIAEAEQSGHGRAMLQVQTSAMQVAMIERDLPALRRHVDAFDRFADAWPSMPPQSTAWAETGRAGLFLLEGDLERAEASLRDAADAALASHDHPVIGMVAIALGTLALERGEYREALRAVDLATAIIGFYDASSPQVLQIERAALEHDVKRAGAEAPTRQGAIESLGQILRR
ncbi:MAG: AAA family ATPase [Lacisediminihabitans sp.]